ncbi:spore germination protein [Shouchella clausii]|uniref:spore germination protein n=1 Tax=Shouchella clausii TaxID=79880 RepID=UPI001C7397A6|nr:spore germination protein [Shouchella clausii]MBX0319614.1 spore germination protein [Shouchella clausii]
MDVFGADYEQNKKKLVEEIGDQADLTIKYAYATSLDKQLTFFYFGEADMQRMESCLRYLNGLPAAYFKKRGSEEERAKPSISYAESVELDVKKAVKSLYLDRVVLLVEGVPFAYVLKLKKGMNRNVEQPTIEPVIRGPKVSFIEDVNANIALVRQYGDDENLIVAEHVVHYKNKQKTIRYIHHKEKTEPAVVEEVAERLKGIQHANIEDSGKVESFLNNSPLYSPFPQIQTTERVDRILGGLEEGRVAIFVDGSPFAFMVPTTFEQQLQAADDYYERWMISSLIRILRYIALFITLFVAPVYIALVSFHQGLIPDELSLTIMNTRMNVPFPAAGEVVVMTLFIELLREASIRLPSPLGQTIGLVGGVVVGQAVVEAHIVSSIMVIIIALTAISSFAVPMYNLSLSFRLLSFVAILFASMFGLFGVACFFIALTIHLASLNNYGVHYFSLKFSFKKHGIYDAILRLPTVLKDKKG